MKRVRCLLIKEITQIRRDPRLFGILILAPLIQLIVLGYAANPDVKQIAIGIRDDDRSYYSREFVRAVGSSDYFETTLLRGPARDDAAELVAGRAGLIAVIPPGFGRRLAQGAPSPVQVLVDGSDSNFGVQGMNYLQKMARGFSAGLARGAEEAAARGRHIALPAIVAQTRAWYNPDLQSRNYMIPGVMGLLLLVTTMIVTSMALVKEREDGTMEQIIVTPLRPGELIAGKLLPFVAIGFVELSLTLPVMRFVFGVPLRGSLLLLYGVAGLFLLTTLGLGLFISTVVKTQQQAMMFSAFFIMLPFALLSGFVFPVENMPASIEVVSRFIPLRYFLVCVRAIFLKGAGLPELWPNALVLLVWGVGILGLAILKFRKRLD